MSRDATRSAVYAAEHLVFAETLFAEPIGPAGVLDLATALQATAWWQRHGVPFEVVPTRRESGHSAAVISGAGARGAQLRLSVHQEDVATLAHEAAHLLAATAGASPAHGPLFVAAELDVVAVLCGTVAGDRLRRAFTEAGLPIAGRSWEVPEDLDARGLYGRWRISWLCTPAP